MVEVLVAISLLLMVIVGPMQILTRANNSTSFATEQQTAWLLAQEGLELAQMGRDNLMLQYFDGIVANPWARFRQATSTTITATTNPGGHAACFTAAGCGIVVNSMGSSTVVLCNPLSNCRLYLGASPSRARYQHIPTATSTLYTRVIRMTQIRPGSQIAASSTVTWRTGSLIVGQRVVTETNFSNIYVRP